MYLTEDQITMIENAFITQDWELIANTLVPEISNMDFYTVFENARSMNNLPVSEFIKNLEHLLVAVYTINNQTVFEAILNNGNIRCSSYQKAILVVTFFNYADEVPLYIREFAKSIDINESDFRDQITFSTSIRKVA